MMEKTDQEGNALVVTDQMGREVTFSFPPKRIISLVPSQSELLADLGLTDKLAGVTKFCIHPEDLRKTTGQIGGTKTVNIEKVRTLQPDLIIGNKEENTQSDIEELEKHLPVWMSDIHDVASALDMIRQMGTITGTYEKAAELANEIDYRFREFSNFNMTSRKLKVLYLIWRKPYMAAGKGTFIDDCLSRCGWENCLPDARYPEINPETVNPELILLSSEPYPFKEKHIAELQELFPKALIKLVDGEYFSWYGSRMLGAPAYFESLLNDLQIDQQS